jgi:hypothetical protein
MQHAPERPRIFFFWKVDESFFFSMLGQWGLWVLSFLFCVMGGFLCYDTLFFWFNLQGACEGPKVDLLHEWAALREH